MRRREDIDPSFVFEFTAYDEVEGPGRRWSTWASVDPAVPGPEPRPDWVVTSSGAVDTDLGILETGKEDDVFVERVRPQGAPACCGDLRQALPRGGAPRLPPLPAPYPVQLDGTEILMEWIAPKVRRWFRSRGSTSTSTSWSATS